MNGCDIDTRARPFNLNPDPRYFYCGPTHRRVLSALLGGIDGPAAQIVLIGQSGTGKTAQIHKALTRFPPQIYTVLIRYTTLSADDLVHVLASELGIASAERAGGDLLVAVREALRDIGREAAAPVIIVDEAQNLCELGLSRLCELARDGSIKLVLVGQPRLCERIVALQSDTRPVPPNLVLELNNLSADESREMVCHRLRVAGEDPDRVFSAEAFGLIHEHTGGNPRRINLLCERVLQFRGPDCTPDQSVLAIVEVVKRLKEEMPSEAPEEPAGKSADRLVKTSSTGLPGGEALGSSAKQKRPWTMQFANLPENAAAAPSRRYTAFALAAMLLLIAVTSWLIEAQFSGDGREPSSGPSDELLELRTQIATLKEDLADTKANQRALLEAMTALRLQNRELRGRIGHSSAKRVSHREWQAPVIEDFAVLETTLATGRDAGAVEYRVRHGDTLLGVAHRHQLSLSQIARWNGLATSALLRAGERLVLTPREELNYTVRWGDTLVALRRQFNVTFNELRRWNALPRDGRLYAGQRLRVYVSLPADS